MTGIPSYTQTIEYYTAKAEKGDVSAMKALGDLYYQGDSGKENNVKAAFPYWKKAADHGDLSAAIMIGTTLIDQSAADSDRAKGFSCLLNASSTENADIQFMLGFCYKKGIGCSASMASAKKYYRMASFQNHEKAQWELGYMQFKENNREGWHWICCSHLNGFPIATEFLNDVLKTDPGMKDWIEPLIDNIRKNGINPPDWISKSDSGACYIATAVYGSYNAPEVIKLRKFRDNILQKHFLGRIFVKIYYFFSPPVAEKLKTATCLNKTVKRLLDKFVEKLNI